jgi:hypothetical protein
VNQFPDASQARSERTGPGLGHSQTAATDQAISLVAGFELRPVRARLDAKQSPRSPRVSGRRPPTAAGDQPPKTDTIAESEHRSGLDKNGGASLDDWQKWLDLSSTPAVASRSEAMQRLRVDGGLIPAPEAWPTEMGDRIYAAFDDVSVVYVGQTSRPLLLRVRNHFSNQHSDLQRRKAGTWRFLVSAVFDGLRPGELNCLERSAAEWLVPLCHRDGRRYPRPIQAPERDGCP